MQTSTSRKLTLLTALLGALVVAAPLSARAAGQLTDDSTGVKFDAVQNVNGTTYQCLGAGVRKVFFFINVYAGAFCVEPSAAKIIADAAKGKSASDLAEDQNFFDSISNAPGGKLVIMHLVRDIKREDLAKAFREAMGKVLPPEKVEKLIGLIPGDPHNGEEVKIFSTGSTLTIDIAGKANKVDDAQIAQNIFLVWLGKDGVSPTLKKSIAQHAVAGL